MKVSNTTSGTLTRCDRVSVGACPRVSAAFLRIHQQTPMRSAVRTRVSHDNGGNGLNGPSGGKKFSTQGSETRQPPRLWAPITRRVVNFIAPCAVALVVIRWYYPELLQVLRTKDTAGLGVIVLSSLTLVVANWNAIKDTTTNMIRFPWTVEKVASFEEKIDGLYVEFKKANNRMDALGTKMGAMETKMDNRMDALETKMDNWMGALESKLDNRMGALESKLDDRMGALGSKLDALRDDVKGVKESQKELDHRVRESFHVMKGYLKVSLSQSARPPKY